MLNLSKWYLDCTTESGDAVVLYWAALRWGILQLRYGAVLLRTGDCDTVESCTLRPGNAPRLIPSGGVDWACGALDVEGSWARGAQGFRRTLLDSELGQIHWNCLAPHSQATVRIGEIALSGSGYVERLTLTLKTWQLPFDKLRWGRCHTPTDVLVWIEWLGSIECSWVFLNGDEVLGARTTPCGVESPDRAVILTIDSDSILRSGRLDDLGPRRLHFLTWLMPGWRPAQETKWLASASLALRSGTRTGRVIHEVVEWE